MIRRRLAHFFSHPWVPGVLALLGGVIFFLQLWIYAHTQTSVLDEGLYLYKGLLFTNGKYQPFQDYGPLTNHMALAFLIPGAIQHWFGAGLRTGRYFAILISLLMLLGLWISARRLGGRWLACAAVWALALNPGVAKISSMAISEGLIACMMMWVIVLTAGEKRPLWQVVLGGGLAAVLVMTRINLLFTLPIVLLYIFWQHGKRTGIAATALGAGVFILLHALYWPNVLRLWAYWLPTRFFPFMAAFQTPAGALPSWEPIPSPFARIMSLLQSLRIHFLAWLGVLSSWMLWPRKDAWKSAAHRRAAFLLTALFVSNAGMHAWASLGKEYCVSCFPIYTTFFAATGLLLLVTILASWQPDLPVYRQVIMVGLVFLIIASIGLGAFQDFNTLFPRLAQKANDLKAPSFIMPGDVYLWSALETKYDITAQTGHQLLRAIPSTLVGILFGILLIASVWLVWHRLNLKTTYAWSLLAVSLCLGLLLTPTIVLGGSYNLYDCTGDTLAAYEQVGAYLARTIPEGSLVYWKGGLSPVPLLYLPDIHIYPSQLNGDYSLRQGGDEDALLRYGWWSMSLAEKWVGEADIVLVEQQYYYGWLKKAIRLAGYTELPLSPPTSGCRTDSQIHVFQRHP